MMSWHNFNPYRLTKILFAILLLSHEKLGGVPVQCFAIHVNTNMDIQKNVNMKMNMNTNPMLMDSMKRGSLNVDANLRTSQSNGNGKITGVRLGSMARFMSNHDHNHKSNFGCDIDIYKKCRRGHGRPNVRNSVTSLRGGSTDANNESENTENNNGEQTSNENKNEDENEFDEISSKSTPQSSPSAIVIKRWPCYDELDKKLIKIALPCIANFAINPLVGAVDLFWINRMGNTLAVAGQAAANQIFSSAFWLTSFLPSVTATLVAKESAKGDQDGVQDSVCQAFIVGTAIAIVGSFLVLSMPDSLLTGVLSPGAPAREFARPYLMIRGFGFLPSMYALIGFSSFRGVMDTVTPLKISLFANLMNAVLDPILIFTGGMGVTGAALATLASEMTSAILFVSLLSRRKMISASKIFRWPKLERLKPLLKGGAALQLRNFALNLTFLAVTRVTQSIDQSGVSAAAHAMAIQTFQIGGIVLLALSTVAQFLIPGEMVEKVDETTGEITGGPKAAKATANRLMAWGFILGTTLGALQVAVLPSLLKGTPVEEVRKAARIPALLGSFYQCFNGLVFIGEGVMVGTGSFLQLSISTIIATLGTLLALKVLPAKFGLTGVWMGFGVFNSLRLMGVLVHQLYSGPLSKRMIAKNATTTISKHK